MLYFLDTNILISNLETLQSEYDAEDLYISNITLNELEYIKTSRIKDDFTKYCARKALHFLNDNENKIHIIPYEKHFLDDIQKFNLPDTNDSKILATAYAFTHNAGLKFPAKESKVFITNDLACKLLGKEIGIVTISLTPKQNWYSGYLTVQPTVEEYSQFYSEELSNPTNKYNLYENEYILLQDEAGTVVDSYKYSEGVYKPVPHLKFESKMFGKIIPHKNDVYQRMAMDSLTSNQVTLLGGPAGSGKTMLALSYLFSELEHGRIDRIIIFCNPTGARNAARLGFYKGTVREKVLSTQVGHVLRSKLGDLEAVEELLDDGVLQIIPVVDARGYEVPPHSGVYVLEAQNLTSDLLRLILQRIGEESKVIIDGDRLEQLDEDVYMLDNGMSKLSEVFRGEKLYGQVDLVNIYRSEIAQIAERMK